MNFKRTQQFYGRTGRPIPNQLIIYDDKGAWFESYQTKIAFVPYTGKTQLDIFYWDYSVTTGKYRNEFLQENITETRKKIKAGEYELIDLNCSKVHAYI